MRSALRSLLQNSALVVAAVALTLILAEFGLRLAEHLRHSSSLAEALEGTEHPPAGSIVTLGQMIRISPNPRIIYELRPNLDVVYRGARVTTNERGFRDSIRLGGNSTTSIRIVGIGDSVMFGQGILAEETYFSRIGHELSNRFPDQNWELTNTAVPGYNTVMEVNTLKAKCLGKAPDLVLIDVVDNDFSLPNFIPTPALRPGLGGPRVWRLATQVLAATRKSPTSQAVTSVDTGSWDPRGLIPTPATGTGGALFPNRRELAPPEYSEFVGVEAVRRSLDDLLRLAAKHSFKVVAVTMIGHSTPTKEEIARILREVGIPLVDAGAAIVRYDKKHRLPQGIDSPLRVSPEEAHPSALAHEIAASAVLDHLLDNKLVQKRR